MKMKEKSAAVATTLKRIAKTGDLLRYDKIEKPSRCDD